MLHEHQLQALDRTLRDLMEKRDVAFGGKVLILAGDFRQTLPVVPGANRPQIVKICINKSHLWRHFKVLSLTQNMRVRASGNPRLENFDQWTVSIGDGLANNSNGVVDIPQDMLLEIRPNTEANKKAEEDSMKEFCSTVFPDLPRNLACDGWLDGRSMLAPTNKEVDTFNDLMETWVPGVTNKLSSADALEDYRDVMRFKTEYLNTLCPNGFPRHNINLKPGMPLMLLHNISPKEGLPENT